MKPQKTTRKKRRAWFLYIMECGDQTLYTGITVNLARREQEHNAGTASRYTRSRRPVTLRYWEKCRGRSDALKKEYAMKQLTRIEKEDYMRTHGR